MTLPKVSRAVMVPRAQMRDGKSVEPMFMERHNAEVLGEVREVVNRLSEFLDSNPVGPTGPQGEQGPSGVLAACMIAQNASTSVTSLTKDVYTDLGGTYAAVGVPDSILEVTGPGVGITYSGTDPARLLVGLSMRVALNGSSATYAMCPHINGSPVTSIVTDIYTGPVDNRLVLNALLDVVNGDVVTFPVTNLTDGTDMLSRRLNATFAVLREAA